MQLSRCCLTIAQMLASSTFLLMTSKVSNVEILRSTYEQMEFIHASMYICIYLWHDTRVFPYLHISLTPSHWPKQVMSPLYECTHVRYLWCMLSLWSLYIRCGSFNTIVHQHRWGLIFCLIPRLCMMYSLTYSSI